MATAKNVPSTVVEMPPTCQLQVQCGIEIWTISTIMTAKTKTKRRVSQDRAVNKTTGWCDDDGDGRWTITIHTILWETQSEASLVYQPSSLRCTSPPVLAVSHGLRKCELGSEMLSCSSIVSYPLLFACFSQREKKYAHAHTHTQGVTDTGSAPHGSRWSDSQEVRRRAGPSDPLRSRGAAVEPWNMGFLLVSVGWSGRFSRTPRKSMKNLRPCKDEWVAIQVFSSWHLYTFVARLNTQERLWQWGLSCQDSNDNVPFDAGQSWSIPTDARGCPLTRPRCECHAIWSENRVPQNLMVYHHFRD